MNLTLFENHWYDAAVDPHRQVGREAVANPEADADAGASGADDEDGDRSLVAKLTPIVLVGGVAAGGVAVRRLARWTRRPRVEIDAVASTNDLDD